MTDKQAKDLFSVLKVSKKLNFTLNAPAMKSNGAEILVELITKDGKDTILFLNVGRSAVIDEKRKCNFRFGSNTIRRIDYFSRHTNPEYIQSKAPNDKFLRQLMQKYSLKRFDREAHIHVYIDGYADKWAFNIDEFGLDLNINIFKEQIEQFCKYCNIDIKVKGGLF
ncbi:DUF6978 family protein [Campylobacter mucosalis]|uniref:Uncharacterized protein n=1 Tax=Campylobacter mucosalis CCUG 21559 TaxID=1032067 RepID=A0A6G5QEV2_9BACT|nr:hypothetical protein [Campylobacter mucosalis]QCD44097.1 hypothetical protein CMUC_0283 [Campylobacter mucosalis CCUG 21559]QCD44689.1 hypothetical protein CMUC_0900 [Campylobacter mucosalis CCUG 21559]